jgi:hypothetical protein
MDFKGLENFSGKKYDNKLSWKHDYIIMTRLLRYHDKMITLSSYHDNTVKTTLPCYHARVSFYRDNIIMLSWYHFLLTGLPCHHDNFFMLPSYKVIMFHDNIIMYHERVIMLLRYHYHVMVIMLSCQG